MDTITHSDLLEMARNHQIDIARVISVNDGFTVSVNDRELISKQGRTRVFAGMGSAGNYLAKAGIREFLVEIRENSETPARRKRPDQAERLARMHRSYSDYANAELAESEARGGRNRNRDVLRETRAIINAKKKRNLS